MIEVSNLSVSLDDKPVLRDYSLTVERGSVLAILGANGVGKTTLLNCIVGLRRPDAGRSSSAKAASAMCRSCSTPPSPSRCSTSS
jgi:iron complex transport system ATP-binding protein